MRCRYLLGHVACRNLPWQGLINSMAVCIVFHLVAEATTTQHVASIEHTIYAHCRREGVGSFVVIENNADIALCSKSISLARDMINIK